jgi:long-chain acyl-CoA synthetase
MPVKRTFDILEHCLRNYPRADAVCGKYENLWIPFSTEQFARRSELLALGLLALGHIGLHRLKGWLTVI